MSLHNPAKVLVRRRVPILFIALSSLLWTSVAAAGQESVDPVKEARSKIEAAQQMLKNNQPDQAVKTLNDALPLAIESKDGYLVAETCLWLGTASLLNGDEQGGQKALDTGISLLERAHADDQVVGTLEGAIAISRKKDLHDTQVKYLRKLADTYAQRSNFKLQAATLLELLQAMDQPSEMKATCEVLEQQLLPLYQKLEDQSGLAISWAAEGKCHAAAGDSSGALTSYMKAIDAFRAIGEKSSLSAMLDSAAENLRTRGRAAEALPLQQESVSIRKGLDNPHDYAQSLNDLALVNEELGHIPDAVNAIEECVKITRTLKDNEALATSLTNEAAVYRDAGRYDDAFKVLSEALNVSRDACLTENARKAMMVMGTIHAAMGDAVKASAAQAVAEDTTDICAKKESQIPEEDKEPAYMKSHNMSLALINMGAYPKAIENLEAELKKAEADHDERATASAHEGLAMAYGESSKFTLAESNLFEAERIYRDLGNPRTLAVAQTSLANLYIRMGRYYDALNVYGEIQRTAASLQDMQLQITTLLSTAEVYRHLKSYDQAFDDAQQALQLSQKNGFRNLAGESQQTIALIDLGRKNYEEAERLFRESVANDPSHRVINDGLVEVYLGTGRYSDAEKELSLVTADQLAHADPGYRLQYYTQRGIARLDLTRVSDAVSDFNLAIQEAEEMRSQFLGIKSVGFFDAGSFGGRVRPYRGMLEAFAAMSLSGQQVKATVGGSEVDPTAAAFHFAELTRGRSLTEKLAASSVDELRKQVPETLIAEERQLSDRMEKLVKQHNELHPQTPLTPEENEEFEKLRSAARAHLDTLEKNYPLYARAFMPGTIPVNELPLAKDEAVLEYAIGLRSIYLFVITQDHTIQCRSLPVSAEQMEAKVRVFRNLVVAKRFSPALANGLFNNLIGDVLPYAELPKRLIIVPDGFLGLLPFEALTTNQNDNPSFLGIDHSITYAQSASVLAWARSFKRNVGAKPLFALADPIFDANDPRYKPSTSAPSVVDSVLPGHSYRRLAETQTEVDSLASIMHVDARPPDVLSGQYAAKSTLQKIDLGAYRYLHFATHAAILGDPGRVNEPFLVLSQVGNPPGDDGLLKMSEIMDLKLNSEMVVLGACDTGRGDILEGDGVASLASAFQFAGAETVVLSLWELPSEATQRFMQSFYQNLKDGRSKTEALQLSRDAMRRQYSDPYYWAVFTMYSGASS
jgi:CHAT domain-containing protein/tetratricopeptide (TPR) repeat protein